MSRKALSLAALFPAIAEAMEIAGSFALLATGSSMEPFLKGGRDLVVLVPPGGRIRRGDILLYQRDSGAFVLHRVLSADKSGTMRIVGDAQYVPESGVRPDQARALVRYAVRDGRRIDCTHGLIRAYMTARMCLRVRFPRAMRVWRAATRRIRWGAPAPARSPASPVRCGTCGDCPPAPGHFRAGGWLP